MTHTMTLLFALAGVYRFHCFVCGRELDICFEPFTKETIEAGEDVPHSGGLGGLRIGVEVEQ